MTQSTGGCIAICITQTPFTASRWTEYLCQKNEIINNMLNIVYYSINEKSNFLISLFFFFAILTQVMILLSLFHLLATCENLCFYFSNVFVVFVHLPTRWKFISVSSLSPVSQKTRKISEGGLYNGCFSI